MKKLIFINDINFKLSPQVRYEPNGLVVAEYAERYRNKADMPPIHVFWDEETKITYLADGMHRCNAMEMIGRKAIEAEVHVGDYNAALKFALLANSQHGLQRSNEDKRQCVRMALKQWPTISNIQIGLACAVDDKTVATVRAEMEAKKLIVATPTRTSASGREMPAHTPRISGATVETADSTVDCLGREIPKKVIQYWQRTPEIRGLMDQVSAIMGVLKEAQKNEDIMFGELAINGTLADLEKAWVSIRCALPYAVCTQCQGHPETQKAGCRLCLGRGLISKFRWDALVPAETKAMLEKKK